ncbi:MAG: serine/threonine-protein kinase, partial [Acidobacteriota bacterium]
EQSEPVKRRVALKVIKLGMDSAAIVSRFEAERQALAVMDHPGIARVFDGGTTPRGRPYFVMELVQGVPLLDYCDKVSLPLRERLTLFIEICRAVQHAHQKGVIHRDLKPSNILITELEGSPVPKIIDFGIAKATGESGEGREMMTELGQMIGTPEYMSPEQADLTTADIDTRTDIYSLGVVFYKLLTGQLPFESETLRGAGLVEMQRIIREQSPQTPSVRLTTLGDREKIAELRRTDPGALKRQLRGDLDCIVMKALEKDRERRYETANDFALDIERHLGNEPIMARPASTAYLTRKFVERHRFGVAFATLMALALIGGIFGTATGLLRAREEARKAIAINSFLQNMLSSVDPASAQGKEVTVREVLDEASKTIDTAFAEQPQVEGELRAVIGRMYSHLGHYAESEPHLERAIAIRRREFGVRSVSTLDSLNSLARVYFNTKQYDRALEIWSENLGAARETYGRGNELLLTWMQNLAARQLAQAVALAEDPATSEQAQREFEQAELLLVEVLEGRRRLFGPQDPRTLPTMNNLAELYRETGRYEDAEPLYVTALELREKMLGADHPRTLISTFNLGDMYLGSGQLDLAEAYLVKARDGFQRVLGDEHPYSLLATASLAELLLDLDRPAEAEPLVRGNFRHHVARYGTTDSRTLEAAGLGARAYEALGDEARAAEWRARATPD